MTGSNNDSIQRTNRTLVLSILRRQKVTTRALIAKATGLKGATITNIVNDLIKAGIVVETGCVEGEKGRKSVGISLNKDSFQIIAIRITRLYYRVGTYDLHGVLLGKEQIEFDVGLGAEAVIENIKKTVSGVLSLSDRTTLSIGVALPGPYLKTENTILQISGFPGWEGINIEEALEETFSIATVVEHDGKASALAEWWYGDYPEHSTLLNVIAGQGNGIGVVTDGHIFSGAHGTAGEFGHSSICFDGEKCACGNRGCLDLYCSTIVLKNNILRDVPKHPESKLFSMNKYSSALVTEAVACNDEFAVSQVKDVSRYLGYGLVNAINVLDPSVIVIGDDLASIGKEVMLKEIQSVVDSRVLYSIRRNVRIALSELSDAILLGAMTVALDRTFNELKFLK